MWRWGAMVPGRLGSLDDVGRLGVALGCALDGDETLAALGALVKRCEALADATHEALLHELGHDLIVVGLGEACAHDGQDLVGGPLDQVAPVAGVGRAAHGPVLEREIHLLTRRVVDPEAATGLRPDPLEVVVGHRPFPLPHGHATAKWSDGIPPVQWHDSGTRESSRRATRGRRDRPARALWVAHDRAPWSGPPQPRCHRRDRPCR